MTVAQEVSSSLKIVLLDEKTEVVLRPLSIRRLKAFMKEFGRVDEALKSKGNTDEAFMDVLVDCAALALQAQLPEQTKYLDNKDYSRDDFEDLVDMNIVSKVNEICGGISFDNKDPNLAAAVKEAGLN